jgi:integrase/recombinase XerD
MSDALLPLPQHSIQLNSLFDQSVQIVLDNLSLTSQRVYLRTYNAWNEFAHDSQFDVLDLTFEHIRAFITQADVAKTTRQNRLSHMRKLLELLAIGSDDYKPHYQAVKSFLKVKAQADDTTRPERHKRALSPHEATQLLSVWSNDTSDMGLRNNAMIRLLIYTGLRRSELVALRWTDINFEDMTLTVRHGKDDKERVVAIVDPSTKTSVALNDLGTAQDQTYTYIFPSMTRGRNPTFADDKPLTDKTVDRVVKTSSQRAGLGDLAPHDLRRTHITEGLNTGATVADMQAQAGHVNASTTLNYAQATDALKRRDRITFRFA